MCSIFQILTFKHTEQFLYFCLIYREPSDSNSCSSGAWCVISNGFNFSIRIVCQVLLYSIQSIINWFVIENNLYTRTSKLKQW